VTDTEANLKWTAGSPYNVVNRATIAVSSGKWYWEVTPTGTYGNFTWLGVVDATVSITNAGRTTSNGWYYAGFNGNKYNGSAVSYGATFGTGNVIGIALDMDAGTLTFYKDNTSQGVAFSTGLTGKTLSPALHDGAADASAYINFGQRPFSHTPPTGFKALNTQNLPDATITKGSAYFDATTYTGNGSTQTITGVGFQPDFVWLKNRGGVENHQVFDSVRGVNNALYPNLTNAAGSDPGVTAFNSNGFGLGNTNNNNGVAYIGWQWKAGGTAVSNTSGSITSSVSAGATQGFSVVTWTGTGSTATVGHGLGVAPKMIIVKSRSGVQLWRVYFNGLTAGNVLYLNTTDASSAESGAFTTTAPTSSVFSVGTSAGTNGSGATYVAYCFAEVAGYSKFGSYTGNGSTDGPFVYCGFRPRFVMVKITSATTGSWCIWDTSRTAYNPDGTLLLADSSGAELSPYSIDVLSNGFKLRSVNQSWNNSSEPYIYAAFAENPTKYSLAR
jgi:hypothetical protein